VPVYRTDTQGAVEILSDAATAGFNPSANFSNRGPRRRAHRPQIESLLFMQKLTMEEAAATRGMARRVVAEVERAVVGKSDVIEMMVIALLARGHVLIEDIPGVGKTTLAKAVARAVGGSFKRVQFTPDLLPGDVTGMTIYNQKFGEFSFNPGPIFANVSGR
jgi:hypothetical protein